MPVPFHGRSLALEGTMPLTLGDWKALQAKGITIARVQKGPLEDAEAYTAFVVHVLRKADPTVTEAEVEALTIPAVMALIQAALPPETAAARPTSTPTTSSGSSTAGAPATSMA